MSDQTPEIEATEDPPPETPLAHVSCPSAMPDLDSISLPELQELRTYLHSQGRDARKKANQAITKVTELRKVWLDSLKPGVDREGREKLLAEFHKELARHPDPFVKHVFANTLAIMAEMVRVNMLKRADTKPAMRKSVS